MTEVLHFKPIFINFIEILSLQIILMSISSFQVIKSIGVNYSKSNLNFRIFLKIMLN